MSQSYHAKLSDFGLAKVGPTESKSHVTTQVMGTHGYAAPEYVATGHLYVKSDVYGFGVVLVEMLTGMGALDTNRPSAQHNLVEWIKPYLPDRRKLKSVMDSRLQGRYPSRSASQIAQLALTCLESDPKNRPSMQEIIETMERIDSAKERNRQPRAHDDQHHYRSPETLMEPIDSAKERSRQPRAHDDQQHYRSPRQQVQNRAYPLPPRA